MVPARCLKNPDDGHLDTWLDTQLTLVDSRSINHRVTSEIRSEVKHKAARAATDKELAEFLAAWPDVDPQTGLSPDPLRASGVHAHPGYRSERRGPKNAHFAKIGAERILENH
jgi:hypothetical protein